MSFRGRLRNDKGALPAYKDQCETKKMKRYWIKLYLEILNDVKMGKMPDWLWRRAIELFLLAGENGDDGVLQPVADMAWRLRIKEDDLVKSLRTLSEIGVVHETPEGWVVTHFQQRQAPSSSSERVREFRKRNGTETNRSKKRNEAAVEEERNTSASASVSESISICESESDDLDFDSADDRDPGPDGQGKPTALLIYEQNIGKMTPLVEQAMARDIAEYSDKWVCEAIMESVKSNAYNLKYIEAILKRWKEEGFRSAKDEDNPEARRKYFEGKFGEFVEH
jgi:DnaD/phage-associated family protein